MSNLFWLSDEQIERLNPFFPKSHGKPSVDDRRALSGIIFINRNGLRGDLSPIFPPGFGGDLVLSSGPMPPSFPV